jgi:anti-sigma factor RsiW
MNQAIEHLKRERLSAYVDRELDPAEQEAVRNHLSVCQPCTLRALSSTQLKAATASAGQRFAASPDSLARLRAHLRQISAPEPTRTGAESWRRLSWAGLAAAALLAVSLVGWQQLHQANTFSAELLDQHLGSLSGAAVPQVISSDRHTVKPWFQGQLPFSFNLPEPQALPTDTILRGANLTYLGGKPAALLLFTLHQHQVSVFVVQRAGGPGLSVLPGNRAGFSIHTAATTDLELIAVSDVNPEDLKALVATLVKAQSPV